MFNGNIPISTHSIPDFFLLSEIVTIWQTDSTAHKLKPRLFCYRTLWTWTIFILFSFIFWLYRNFVFFFFFFSFGQWRGTWHCSHMTCHMMWFHRPRRWWKDLKDDIKAYVYNMATLRQTWERSIDIRAELIISSMDHKDFV